MTGDMSIDCSVLLISSDFTVCFPFLFRLKFFYLSLPSNNHFKLCCYSDTVNEILDYRMSLKIETCYYNTNVLVSSLKTLSLLIYISYVYSFNNQL